MTAEVDGAILRPGARLVGKFDISGLLGRGGFGITYDGFDTKLRRRVAIKELFPDGAMRRGSEVVGSATLGLDHLRNRFIEEAQALARFDHQAIVRVLEAFEDNGTAYMVMEYLEGENLEQRCDRLGRLTSGETTELTLQVCDALERVHREGILHRDVKPSNIVLHPMRGAVLIDFGSARQVQVASARVQTQMVSHGYSAPEQYGAGRLGPATDIYGLGATVWHAVTGKAPLSTLDLVAGATLPDIREAAPGVSPQIISFVDASLRMDAAKRPQSIAEARLLLKGSAKAESWPKSTTSNISKTKPIKTVQVGGEQFPKTVKSSKPKTPWIVGAAIVAAGLVGATALTLRGTSDTPELAAPSDAVTVTDPGTLATGTTVVATSAPLPTPSTGVAVAADQPVSTKTVLSPSAPIVPVRFLMVSSAGSATTRTHRNAVALAISEAKDALAKSRVNLSVDVGELTAVSDQDVLAVFSSGGSAAAAAAVDSVRSAGKALIVVDGTSDALSPSAFRTIATDSEQGRIAGEYVRTLSTSDVLVLEDASPESRARADGFLSVIGGVEIVLDGSNTNEAVAAWTPGTALFVAASDMSKVAAVLKASKLTAAQRVVVGVDGMFDLPGGSYLTGARCITSLAPVEDDAVLSQKLRAAGLGQSDGDDALFAYESARAAIDAIVGGATTGRVLQARLAEVNPPKKTRTYTYKSGAWR